MPVILQTESFTIEHFAVGPMDNNLYLLIDHTTREFVVIDPSIASDEALLRAQSLIQDGLRLTAIWNTHGHFDHVLDNHRWKAAFDVPLWMHEGDLFFIERLREQALWFGFAAPQEVPPDEFFSENQTLQIGEMQIRVLHTPGHSPGSVSFYLEDLNVCISGDVVFKGSAGRTDLPGCSEQQLAESLHLLLSLPTATRLLPGHGPDTDVAHEKQTNPIYLSLASLLTSISGS